MNKLLTLEGKQIFRSKEKRTLDFEGIPLTITSKLKSNSLTPSCKKMLLVLMSGHVASGGTSCISVPIDDYMALRGLNNKDRAIKDIRKDLTFLYNASIGAKDSNGNSYDFRILQSKGVSKSKGIFQAQFTDDFCKLLNGYTKMYVPNSLLSLDTNVHRSSFELAIKMLTQTQMNRGKKNEHVISVKALLRCSGLPSIEDVRSSNRAYKSRIIEPLIKELDAISELSYHFMRKNKSTVSKSNVKNLDIEDFANLYVYFSFTDYPEQPYKE